MSVRLFLSILFLTLGEHVFSLKCPKADVPELDKSQPRFTNVNVPVEGECKTFKVYLVTYASETDRKDFCAMATSAFAHGFELNIIGHKRQAQWKIYGYMEKFWTFREFLDMLPDGPDVIVVFADAYDVLFTETPKHLVKYFLKSKKQVLISSEKGCCSDWLVTVEGYLKSIPIRCDETWPPATVGTAMPYMNSGAYMGYASALRTLLQHARQQHDATVRIMQDRGYPIKLLSMGEQPLLCHLFSAATVDGGGIAGAAAVPAAPRPALLRDTLGMGIDYRSSVFVSMHLVDLDTEIGYTRRGRVVYTGNSTCDHLRGPYYQSCESYMRSPSSPRRLTGGGGGGGDSDIVPLTASLQRRSN